MPKKSRKIPSRQVVHGYEDYIPSEKEAINAAFSLLNAEYKGESDFDKLIIDCFSESQINDDKTKNLEKLTKNLTSPKYSMPYVRNSTQWARVIN